MTAFLGYVLPYGQMSLWGKFLPQMCNFNSSILLISVFNIHTGTRFNKIRGVYRIGPHNIDILSIIYGTLLGDGHAEKRSIGVGTRISFYQEHTHLAYIFYLHKLLHEAGYCNEKLPKTYTRLGKNGKVRKVLRFHTWTYTSFNQIQADWYDNKVKRIPYNLEIYLTPLALAIWIMDDGGKVNSSLKLSTNSFTYAECITLVNILYKNFNLKASVQSAGCNNQYIIYIWKESMEELKKIVSPYIIPSMKYKIT